MKQGRSLQELAVELERQKNVKKDFLVDTRNMFFDIGESGSLLSLRNEAKNETTYLGVNEIAHDQIGAALKIPAKYYDMMRSDNPELLAQNINSWFQKDPKVRLVRTLDGQTRAFLSDSYRRIDNWDVAQTSLETLVDIGDLKIESCEVTEQRMYIKVVNPRLETEVVPGDYVQSGILITNSEVGLGSMSVQPLVYRLVCSNGMVVNDAATRKYHVGRRNVAEEDFSLYTDETLKLDDMALMAKIRDTVRAVADQTRFDKVVEMMRNAKGIKIETPNIPQFVELVGTETKLYTQKEGEGILNHLIRGGDFTMYGMSNAVTRYAQDVESYDRSTELESIGYSILGLSADKWAKLNAMSVVGKVA